MAYGGRASTASSDVTSGDDDVFVVDERGGLNQDSQGFTRHYSSGS